MSHFPSLSSRPDEALGMIFNTYEQQAAPIHQAAQAIMRSDSPFNPGEREFIAAYVSSLNGCPPCRDLLLDIASRNGVPPYWLAELEEDFEKAGVDSKIKQLCHFAGKLTEAPRHIDQDEIDLLLEAGISETAIMHTILVCGLFNCVNRLVNAVGISMTDELIHAMAGRIQEEGYDSLTNLARKAA